MFGEEMLRDIRDELAKLRRDLAGADVARIIQITMALEPVGPGQAVQCQIGLDNFGRTWKRTMGSQFSTAWGEWELVPGRSLAEIEAALPRPARLE